MSNLPMRQRRRLQAVCSHCKVPLEDLATYGGWNPHLCPDKLRSGAFDFFLNALAGVDQLFDWTPGMLRSLYLRVPPRERPALLAILDHAGVPVPQEAA